jgi:hypothetical protein
MDWCWPRQVPTWLVSSPPPLRILMTSSYSTVFRPARYQGFITGLRVWHLSCIQYESIWQQLDFLFCGFSNRGRGMLGNFARRINWKRTPLTPTPRPLPARQQRQYYLPSAFFVIFPILWISNCFLSHFTFFLFLLFVFPCLKEWGDKKKPEFLPGGA